MGESSALASAALASSAVAVRICRFASGSLNTTSGGPASSRYVKTGPYARAQASSVAIGRRKKRNAWTSVGAVGPGGRLWNVAGSETSNAGSVIGDPSPGRRAWRVSAGHEPLHRDLHVERQHGLV